MEETAKKFERNYMPSEETRDAWLETLGNNIRQMRLKKGLSQEAVARELGVSYQRVSRWERGKRMPGIEDLYVLSKYYNCKPSEFFKGIDGM